MAARKTKSKPTWIDVKGKLADFDRPGLLGLIQDLYAANKENQMFLHSRFGLGGDVLEPYKKIVSRWLWPDVYRNQDISVAKAKGAVSRYGNATGDPAGLAELMVFYCEQAAGFCSAVGYADENYFNALVKMYEQALKVTLTLDRGSRKSLLARLDEVRSTSHDFGYAVGDDMDDILAELTSS